MIPKENIVKKAVFPVAGLGTRFLPATKASPKEMLNVVDKPLIQYAAEEAVSAGIDTLIFVTGRNKVSIPNHFDRAYELERKLLQKNKNSVKILPNNESSEKSETSENSAVRSPQSVVCSPQSIVHNPK